MTESNCQRCFRCGWLLDVGGSDCDHCSWAPGRSDNPLLPGTYTIGTCFNVERLSENVLLCVVAFLFRIVGIAFGAYGLTRQDAAWRNTGRAMIS